MVAAFAIAALGALVLGLIIGVVIEFVRKRPKKHVEITKQMEDEGRPKEEIQVALVKADQENFQELQLTVSKKLNAYPESVQKSGLALSAAMYHHFIEVLKQFHQGNLTREQAFDAFKAPITGALEAVPLAELTGAENNLRLLLEDGEGFQDVPFD